MTRHLVLIFQLFEIHTFLHTIRPYVLEHYNRVQQDSIPKVDNALPIEDVF